jgi:hypothetical protein
VCPAAETPIVSLASTSTAFVDTLTPPPYEFTSKAPAFTFVALLDDQYAVALLRFTAFVIKLQRCPDLIEVSFETKARLGDLMFAET